MNTLPTITILTHIGRFYRVVECAGVESYEETSLSAVGELATLGNELIIIPANETQGEKLSILAHLMLHRARMTQVLDDLKVETITLRMALMSTELGRDMLAERERVRERQLKLQGNS